MSIENEIPLLPTPTTMDDLAVRTPEQIRSMRQIGGAHTLREVVYYLAIGQYDEVYGEHVERCSVEEYQEQKKKKKQKALEDDP